MESAHQAFRYGNKVYGVQFHPECRAENFRRWQQSQTATCGTPGAQSREEQVRLMALHHAAQGAWFGVFCNGSFWKRHMRRRAIPPADLPAGMVPGDPDPHLQTQNRARRFAKARTAAIPLAAAV